MFAAVLAATLFMLSAATGGSAADSCTASLPPLVGGGGECSASGGGDLVNEVRQNVSTLLPGVVRCRLLGCTPEYPACEWNALQRVFVHCIHTCAQVQELIM